MFVQKNIHTADPPAKAIILHRPTNQSEPFSSAGMRKRGRKANTHYTSHITSHNTQHRSHPNIITAGRNNQTNRNLRLLPNAPSGNHVRTLASPHQAGGSGGTSCDSLPRRTAGSQSHLCARCTKPVPTSGPSHAAETSIFFRKMFASISRSSWSSLGGWMGSMCCRTPQHVRGAERGMGWTVSWLALQLGLGGHQLVGMGRRR